jgi:transposase-like protein
MTTHPRAKLGLAGRRALVEAIEAGMTLKAAAAAFNVSPATAHRWWHRWVGASERARLSSSCLHDRSSVPGASRVVCLRRRSSRSCAPAERRTSAPGGWPAC